MRIGVLGTGQVGQTVADRLIADGHEVVMGSRTSDNVTASAWATAAGHRAGHGVFAHAAAAGELLFNCTAGVGSLAALDTVARDDLAGKILIDVANPLDFSGGFPPTLALCNTTSVAEEIQRAHPDAKVVKALNTMSCSVMVDPVSVPGEHHVFVCGDDPAAKTAVSRLLAGWGWPETAIIDLGDLTCARGTEMVLPLWVRLYGVLGTADFNLAVVR